ncbi:ABC transporter ATP-binding protein [Fulvivirgaceae bacterium PWU4]|uniref:ABC transporter ATP-binding protein n=2 Tax=Chryseosolibacter histidini TaxID=2782349 RepID=A0AAP2DH29_9BACT|nr:ABC transporter ATP-binding protein [Chryseosolibacter histidini]
MNPIVLENINHFYDGRQALRDLSVSFAENQCTAILGKSGSGKSTLLQVINGLVKPASGSVTLFGDSYQEDKANVLRQKLGYVIQGNGLFPHLTVEQNISISARIIGYNKAKTAAQVNKLMTLVDLPLSYKGKYPYELSGGEQQRVGLCRALFLDPPVLLMDEPLSALDSVTRLEIQQEIIKLQREAPRTILFVTHDMREAKKLADRILVIDRGSIEQYGAAETVLQHPATAVVKQLFEASLA